MAGKARKQRERDLRKKAKQARRERNQALYESRKLSGTNSKSKRHVLSNRRGKKSHGKHTHVVANCGNPGCKDCFTRILKPGKPGYHKLFAKPLKRRKKGKPHVNVVRVVITETGVVAPLA